MIIAGYKSDIVLEAMKKLAKKEYGMGYSDKELAFFQSVEEWHSGLAYCTHENTKRVERVLANGTVAHYVQCQSCGWGKAIKKEDKSVEGEWNSHSQEIRNLMFEARSKINPSSRQITECEYRAERHRKSVEFWDNWRSHLASEKWRSIREKVIKRANGMCEGCLDEPIQEVHHKTYAHLGDEFCFELIGLCSKCHKRFHGLEVE